MKTEPVRLAVWGSGKMGRRIALSAAAHSGIQVVSVIDREPDRAGEVANAVGAEAAGSLDEALERSGATAVYIGLPNAEHRGACLAAASRNLDVLIDKPLATSTTDAEDILTAAADSSGFWMMGFSYRFRAEWCRAQRLIQDGVLGNPYFICDNVFEAYETTPSWYWEYSAQGGAINLQAHHIFDRWEWIVGKQISALSAATAGSDKTRGERDAEVAFSTQAQLGGSLATASVSFGLGYDAAPRAVFTVQCTRGMIEVGQDRRIIISTVDGTRTEDYAHDDWVARQMGAFAAGIQGETTGLPTIGDGARAVRLGGVAQESARRRSWIDTFGI